MRRAAAVAAGWRNGAPNRRGAVRRVQGTHRAGAAYAA